MKTFFTLLVNILILFNINAQTSLAGKVIDGETGEPILFGTVAIYQDGVLKTGGETDFDGNYSINPLDPGTYDVEFTYVGIPTTRIEGVVVAAGKSNTLDAQMGGQQRIYRRRKQVISPATSPIISSRMTDNIVRQTPKTTITKTPSN